MRTEGMATTYHKGKTRRLSQLGGALGALVLGGVAFAALASGAPANGPSMEVLPSSTGLKYRQTVTIKAHKLPKGSGVVAATICGLEDASGKAIAKVGADDCAGQPEVGKLVQVKSWESNGEFETKYALPASGQKFGKNQRFCDKAHHCALVVADANPDKPAYYLSTVIQFVDQQPFGGGAQSSPNNSTTTKPTSSATQGSGSGTDSPGAGASASANAKAGTTGTGAGGAAVTMSADVDVRARVALTPTPGAPAAPPLPSAPPDPSTALQQAQAGMQSPTLLCVAGQQAWQGNAQVTDACNQVAGALP
jgi:hypothetical protein